MFKQFPYQVGRTFVVGDIQIVISLLKTLITSILVISPVKEPLHRGNMSWIDTGAFATNNLTVIEVQ